MKYIISLILCFASFSSLASENIRLVISSGAGGIMHQYALKIAPLISKELDRKVLIEIKPGAEGYIAASYVHQFTNNSTVILIGSPQRWTSIPNAKINHIDDFELVGFLGSTSTLIATNYNSKSNTLSDFLEESKSRKVTYGISSTNPIRPLFKKVIETYGNKDNFVEVVYKSPIEGVSAILGNHIDFAASVPENILEHVEVKKLKVIGVVSAENKDKLKPFRKLSDQGLNIADEFKYYPNIFLWSNISANKDDVKRIRSVLYDFLRSKESEDFRRSMHLSFNYELALNSKEYLKRILE